MKYYPAFINLINKKVIVVGGGSVAARKVRSLIKAGASVTVISPVLKEGLARLKAEGKIQHRQRTFQKGDLRGAFVVIAATSDEQTNRKVARDAEHLINVTSIPDEGNFIVPSLIKRGPLMIAISTEGASPAVSKAIRKEIEKNYDREFIRYLRFVELIRKKAMKMIPDSKKREKFLKYLASEPIVNALRNKGFNEASQKVLAALEKAG